MYAKELTEKLLLWKKKIFFLQNITFTLFI
jgi:hypothetical protein